MARIKDWRNEIGRLDADEIDELIQSLNQIGSWPIFAREYGELRPIVTMLQARADFLTSIDNDTAKCLACSYRVEGICPLPGGSEVPE